LTCVCVGNTSHHLFSALEGSKLSLSNLSVRQESGHSDAHGILVAEGLSAQC